MYAFLGTFLSILGLRYPIEVNVEKFYKKKKEERLRSGSLDIGILSEIDPDKNIDSDDLEAAIDIECIRIPKFTDFTKNYKKILYWFYSLIVFGILMSEPILLIVKAINEKNLIYISNISFLIISPVQQIIAIKYFRSQSFDKIYYEVSKLKDTRHCIKNDKSISVLILVPSIMSVIFSAIFIFYNDDENNMYNYFQFCTNKTGKVFLFIYQLIFWFYSRTILFLVLIIFFYVFFKHLNDMRSLIYTVEHNNVWVDDQTVISEFIHAIIKLRYELNNSIEKLSNIYVFATVIGAIGIGNVIDNKKIDSFTMLSMVIFVICQAVFLFIIYLITEQQRKLGNIIRHPVFSLKYIYRKYRSLDFGMSIIPKTPLLSRGMSDNDLINLSATSTGRLLRDFREKSIKSNKTIDDDGNGLYQIYQTEYENVVPMGNLSDIHEEDSERDNGIKRKRKKKKIMRRVVVDSEEILTEENIENNDTTIDKKDDVKDDVKDNSDDMEIHISPITKDIIKKINQISSYNGSSIDYIILHLMINDNWTSNFDLLGIKFDNAGAIKKAVTITSVIMIISGMISELQVFL